jgi:choline dehydrogenase
MAKRRHGSLGSANTSLVRTIISTDEDHQIENCDDITIATKPCTVRLPKHPYVGEVCQIVADTFKEEHEKSKHLHIHGGEYPINGGNIELSESSTVTLTFTVHKEWIPSCCGGNKGSRHVDYVIVGLGTAGCPLARYLSEDMKTSVIVLEAGENHASDPAILQGAPFGDSTLANNPKYSFARLNDPADIAVGSYGTTTYSDGRMWGGGSGHNGIVAAGQEPDAFNAWGLISSQWSYNSLLPVMLFLEHYTPNGTVANPAQRGLNGPLFITQDPPLPANHFYSDFAIAANAPPVSDYNDPTLGAVGIAASQWYATPGTNQRSWSQTAFLPPSVVTINSKGNGKGVGKRKLDIFSRSTAVELIFEKDKHGKPSKHDPKVIGVRYTNKNSPEQVLEVFASKKVILSAGTIANAALLQASGIGDKTLLSSLDIDVILDNPNVGLNMQNHYGPIGLIQMDALNPVPFQAGQANIDLSGNVAGGYNLTSGGVGVPPAQVQPHDGVRRSQVYTVPGNFLVPRAVLTGMGIQNIPAISILMYNLIPNRLGTVKINSTDPLTTPTIQFHYYQDLVTPTDLDRTVAMYKVMANIAQQYGTTMLYPPVAHYPAPFGPAPDDSLLIDDAKNITLIAAYHAVGTCRMATSKATGVVDGDLNVFGVKHLACCDDSVAPTITKGNTAFPAYLLGLQKAKIEGGSTPF